MPNKISHKQKSKKHSRRRNKKYTRKQKGGSGNNNTGTSTIKRNRGDLGSRSKSMLQRKANSRLRSASSNNLIQNPKTVRGTDLPLLPEANITILPVYENANSGVYGSSSSVPVAPKNNSKGKGKVIVRVTRHNATSFSGNKIDYNNELKENIKTSYNQVLMKIDVLQKKAELATQQEQKQKLNIDITNLQRTKSDLEAQAKALQFELIDKTGLTKLQTLIESIYAEQKEDPLPPPPPRPKHQNPATSSLSLSTSTYNTVNSGSNATLGYKPNVGKPEPVYGDSDSSAVFVETANPLYSGPAYATLNRTLSPPAASVYGRSSAVSVDTEKPFYDKLNRRQPPRAEPVYGDGDDIFNTSQYTAYIPTAEIAENLQLYSTPAPDPQEVRAAARTPNNKNAPRLPPKARNT